VEEKMTEFDFQALYGDNDRTKFWHYGGSFTTPPCTEAVDFYIMMQPAVMTTAQLAKFKVAIGWTNAGGNFRPPQPLGSRVVGGCARLATMANRLEDQHTSLKASIKQAIEESVGSQMASTLNDEQGSQAPMLIVLLVLAGLITAVSCTVFGMMFKVVKSVKSIPLAESQASGEPAQAPTQVPAQAVGAAETRQEV